MVVGKTVAQAQKARVAKGYVDYGVTITKEIVDTKVRPETVLSATRNNLTIAVPKSKPCAVGQLALTLGTRNGASQRTTRGLFVRNASPQWCTLRSPMTLVGLGPSGVPDTNSLTVRTIDASLDALSPNTPPRGRLSYCTGTGVCGPYPKDVLYARIAFTGADVCSLFAPGTPKSVMVHPTTWRVTFPGAIALTTPNRNPLDPSDDGFASCGGGIGDEVVGPQTISAR